MKTEKMCTVALSILVAAALSGCAAAPLSGHGVEHGGGDGANAVRAWTPPERSTVTSEHTHHYGARVSHMSVLHAKR